VSFIKNLTLNCRDAMVEAHFWAAVLGTDVDEDSTDDKAFVEAAAWGGPGIWFNGGGTTAPEAAATGLHLDLRSLTTMDSEVDRLVGIGARVVRRQEGLVVLADPEGNEFCVEPGPEDPHPGPDPV